MTVSPSAGNERCFSGAGIAYQSMGRRHVLDTGDGSYYFVQKLRMKSSLYYTN